MTRLAWNPIGERFYETGVDRGVLYPRTGPGVPWNGLVSVSEDGSGGEIESLYFDGNKYLDIVANEDFSATLEAFAAPPQFAACDGSKQLSPGLFATQQPRQTFGLSYRTMIGSDLDPNFGYKLHIVYNCTAGPSGRTNQTIGETASPATRSWNINCVPPPASTFKPTAHFVIDSTTIDPGLLENLESYLYGRADLDPTLPSQDEIITVLANVITEPLTEPI